MRLQSHHLGLLGYDADGHRTAPYHSPADLPAHDFIDLDYRGPVVGKGRPRASHRHGVFRVHTPAATIKAEDDLKFAMQMALPPGFKILDFALLMLLDVRVAVPKSYSKRNRALALEGRLRPTTKPDLDNVIKMVGDAGNKLLFTDDALVTAIVVERYFAADAGLRVRLRRAGLPIT